MTTAAVVDLSALLPSWKLALQADRKSKQTVDAYTTGVRLFLEWCAEHGHAAALDRQTVRTWVRGLLDGGAAPATARTRQMALKRYSPWLLDEDEIDVDLIRDLKRPKLVRVPGALTATDLTPYLLPGARRVGCRVH